MRIKSLTLSGFKSFADKTTIEFQDGLTGVVGPNGSGKSNIIEGLRWVLGEQSAKNLRGGKMPDVIFAGSQTRAPLNRCMVQAVFDNTDHYLKNQQDDVTITRKIYRNGDSEYLINGKQARLRDIVDLFTDTGVGRESFSIISQGSVGEIFNSKPQDRRMLIEEAAGIVKYKKEKSKAKTELSETTDHLDRVSDILLELERQKDPLEEQASIAHDYLEQKKQYEHYELSRLVLEIKETSALKEEVQGKLEEIRSIAKKHQRNADLSEEKNRRLHEKQQTLEEKLDEAQKELIELTRQKEKLASKRDLSDHDSEFFEQRIAEQKEAVKNDQFARKEASVSLVKLKRTVQSESEEKAKLEEKLEKLRETRNSSDSDLESQIEDVRNKIMVMLQEKATFENQLEYNEKEKLQVSDTKEAAKKRSGELSTHLKELEQKKESLQQKFDLKDEELKSFTENYQNDQQLQLKISRRHEDAQRRWLEASGVFQQAKARYDSKKQIQADYSGYYQGVKSVMRAKNLNGIVGPVAEVFEVPKKLAKAVETALGASLQNIVVHDVSDAKAAIRYLTQNKLGRATFLPRTTVKQRFLSGNQVRLVQNVEGFIGVGCDLIACDDDDLPVLRHLLGAVIFAENLDSATEIAKILNHSVKVVSLAGDVVNAGGSMSGGENKRQSEGLIEQKQSLEKLGADIETMTQKLAEIEIDGAKLRKRLEEINEKLGRSQTERERLEKERSEAKTLLDEISLEYAKKEQEKSVYDADLENSRVNETRFSEAKKAAQAKLEELEGKIKASQDLLEEKIAFQKNKASEQAKLDAKIAEDAGRLAVLTERIQSLSIRVKENEFQIAQADERIEKNGERIRQLENESKSMLLSKDELIEKEKEADERCLKLEKEVSRMQEERSALHENVKKSETELTRANELLRAAMDERSTLSAKDGNLQATLRQNLDELAEHYAMTYESAEQKNTEEDLDFVKKKVKLLKLGIEELGDVNVNAIAQFEEVNERYEFLRQQQDDLLEAKEQLLLSMEEMDEEVKRRFKVTFNKVSSAFTEIFPEVFGGGHAELSLTDPQNLLETGLEIMAAPPGKKYRQLSLLSGGERSLTAIVLLFAILKVKPVPFAILDEAEAALDDANVARYSQYLRKFDGQTQFIVITHRKGTMMQADVLYGVTMQESGVSKMVSVSLDDYD